MSAQSDPKHDRAVIFCCDRHYFPYALFVLRQIVFHCPNRDFDFVVATQDDLEIPQWAADVGLRVHKVGQLDPAGNLARFRGSLAPLFRMLIAKELGHLYRRVLYLDCDLFFEGADLSRLMEVNLGPHAFGVVRDVMAVLFKDFHAPEFKAAGLPAFNYFNTGVMVLDTAAFIEQDLEARGWDVAKRFPQSMTLADQSILNMVLQGKYAELAPCWNWMSNVNLPLVPHTYPVYFRHFVGQIKPNTDPSGRLEARFRHAYVEFFRLYMPEMIDALSPPGPSAPMPITRLSQLLLRQYKLRNTLPQAIARFKDAWDVKI
jgi:Glycosyl transferase family 8